MQLCMNRRRVCAIGPIALLGCWIAWCLPATGQTPSGSGTVLTIAGSGMFPGFAGDGGAAVNATLSGPEGLAIGRDGTIYFSDASNYRIRQIKPGSGIISTMGGTGPPPPGTFLLDGPNGDGGAAIGAQLGPVDSLAIDRQRNILYLSSAVLDRVRQVNLNTGVISNFAGVGMFSPYPAHIFGDNGPASGAFFLSTDGVAVGANHDVYITDSSRSRLHSVSDATGIISPLAGANDAFGNPKNVTAGNGGLASQASLGFVTRVTVDPLGNIFILDPGGGTNLAWTVRRIDATSRIIDKVAGGGTVTPGASGPATSFNFNGLGDMALDESGNLFISDQTQIFKVNLSTGQLAPYAGGATADFSGDGGPAADARFHQVLGMTVAPGGGLFIRTAPAVDQFPQRRFHRHE
jgi:serine/threonine-protein kinase